MCPHCRYLDRVNKLKAARSMKWKDNSHMMGLERDDKKRFVSNWFGGVLLFLFCFVFIHHQFQRKVKATHLRRSNYSNQACVRELSSIHVKDCFMFRNGIGIIHKHKLHIFCSLPPLLPPSIYPFHMLVNSSHGYRSVCITCTDLSWSHYTPLVECDLRWPVGCFVNISRISQLFWKVIH